jgi:two-component system alkaline phosphatase synthesis response regulator PhoP
LIADDDRKLVDMLTYWLRAHGHQVIAGFDGDQAIKRWVDQPPDLVLLDIQMPKYDGFEVIRRMRTESNAMILVLTCCDGEEDEVSALNLGADDFLRKPFRPRQLLARIQAAARRATITSGPLTNSFITVGPVSLDVTRHEVSQNGTRARLTPTESRLLHLLLTHAGQVLTTDTIIERVWGYNEIGDSGLVKTHIRHLRQKVEPEPSNPRYLVTVPGVGYTFSPPVTDEQHLA